MTKQQLTNYALIGLAAVTVLLAVFLYLNNRSLQAERNKLTKRDAEVQKLDTKLNIAESNLLTEKQINRLTLDDLSHEVRALMRKYDLTIQSRDETIAKLVSTVRGGSTNVVVENTTEIQPEVLKSIKIGYAWEDKLKRFHLNDPNIWDEDDETFTSQQYLRVRGYVLKGKEGKLQTRNVEVEEIYKKGVDKNGKPTFALVPDSAFELVDATFDYVDPKVRQKSWLHIFALRPYASFDTAVMPGIGLEFIQLGNWIDWANVGLGAELSAALDDPLGGSLQHSRVGANVHYHFIPPWLGTNMALGAGLSWAFNDLSTPVFSVDAMFYLSDPIPLFGD